MNKELRELLSKISAKTAEAKGCDDVEKASAIMDEVDALQKEYETKKRIFDAQKAFNAASATAEPEGGAAQKNAPNGEKKAYTAREMLAKEVRAIVNPRAYGIDKALSEQVGADGGFVVPEDIQTAVNQYLKSNFSWLDLISEEEVTRNKGARTYQTKKRAKGFQTLASGAIAETESPTFERVEYSVVKRAGYIPVDNDLVDDSDANIEALVTQWLSEGEIATINEQTYAALKNAEGAKTATISKLADVKKIVNVTLGQAYKPGCVIVTNDSGLNYFDTLEDNNGRPLLNPDPTQPHNVVLSIGSSVVDVKAIPDSMMPNESDGAIPVFVGDFKAAAKRFKRKGITIDASNTAVIGKYNAFANDSQLMRAIIRDDYKVIDKDAYVVAKISATAAGKANNG